MEQVTWQSFKEFLLRVRRRAGLSQERLAQLMVYDRTYIWRLEKGERFHPSAKFLTRLGQAIPLSPADQQRLTWYIEMAQSHPDHREAAEEASV